MNSAVMLIPSQKFICIAIINPKKAVAKQIPEYKALIISFLLSLLLFKTYVISKINIFKEILIRLGINDKEIKKLIKKL